MFKIILLTKRFRNSCATKIHTGTGENMNNWIQMDSLYTKWIYYTQNGFKWI